MNTGGKIVNVQWDFDFRDGIFSATQGYQLCRKEKKERGEGGFEGQMAVEYTFEHVEPGTEVALACRVQDDLGGEGMKAMKLKVALKYIRPPIWRRVVLPDNFTLGQLHEVIQVTMGWYNRHMHAFRVPRRGFGAPLREFGSGLDAAENENTTFVGAVLVRKGQKLLYEYDFGDGWEHEIVVEKMFPFDPRVKYPACFDGARACPPEDCGSFPGYMGILDALKAQRRAALWCRQCMPACLYLLATSVRQAASTCPEAM